MARGRKARRGSVVVLVIFVVTACGSVVLGGSADVELTVYGDEETELSSQAPPDSESIPPARQTPQPFEGTVTLQLRVLLVSGAFPLTIFNREGGVEVDVTGGDPQPLGSVRVSSGIYQGLRVVFSEVTADLTSGLGTGDDAEGGIVTVDLGEDDLVELELDDDLLVLEGAHLDIALEIRSADWLGKASQGPQRTVSEADFLDAVRVRTRLE